MLVNAILGRNKALYFALAFGCLGSICLAEELPRVIDASGPSREDAVIARTVNNLIQRMHVSQRKFDDELSSRAFDQLLKMLDPMKMYFYKSDIAEFETFRDKLDDQMKKGDINFAYVVFKKYLQRVQSLMPTVHALIDQDNDFTIDEKVAVDREVVDYPADDAESKERWRKQIKYSFLVLKADGKKDEQIREQLHKRYKFQERNRKQTDVYELLEMYLTALTSSLDPHSTYMAPRQQDNFEMQLKLKLQGIGAQLSPEDGYTTVASLVRGGAAAKDGRLKVGDRIVAVGQEGSPDMVSVVDMKLDDVVSLVRGKAGTKVRLKVEPKAGGEPEIYEIVRAMVQLEDQAARGEVLERGKKANGDPFLVGYINLPSFYMDMEGARRNEPNFRSTTRDMKNILEGFKSRKVDSVVIDLTRNGGGSLTEAINCTGLFVDRGPIVQVKVPTGEVEKYDDEDDGVSWDGPLVVMTTKLSASASEIFAGAIKDYGRGIVVGDPTTHGKGTVQTLVDVSEALFRSNAKPYGALKVTIQQFYLPDGHSTQREGVAADVVLPSLTSYMDIGEADLEFALPADKVPAQPHQAYNMVESNVRVNLQQKSSSRIEQSKDFAKLLRKIELYRNQKEEKYASLLESDFLARRAEFDAQDEEDKQLEETQVTQEKTFNDTYYNEEVLSIARDYFDALQQQKLAKAG